MNYMRGDGPMVYIRLRYGVPAKRGRRVAYLGKPGFITGARAGRLRVKLDNGQSIYVHPKDDSLNYNSGNKVIDCENDVISITREVERLKRSIADAETIILMIDTLEPCCYDKHDARQDCPHTQIAQAVENYKALHN